MVNWSALPTDAIEFISTRLQDDADYVRFRAVCTSWRSAAPKRPHLPWLIVESKVDDNEGSSNGVAAIESRYISLGLLNLPNTGDILRLPHLPDQGRIRIKSICGSSRGWIAILEDTLGISLHNPFTGSTIRLPHLIEVPSTPTASGWQVIESDRGFHFFFPDVKRWQRDRFPDFGRFLVKKIVLSSDPVRSPEDCIVLAICYGGRRLIHCRLGDSSWAPLSLPSVYTFEDIIFYQGRFYAVSGFRVFVFHTGLRIARATEILPPKRSKSDSQAHDKFERNGRSIKSYLVVSAGDLLLATISYGAYNDDIKCEVFGVDLDAGQLRLIRVTTLGGRALFFGDQSMSLSTASSAWCKGNCIYYSYRTYKTIPYSRWLGTNAHPINIPDGATVKLFHNISIFNLEDGTSSSIPSLPDHFCELHWFTPSLC